LKTNLKDSFNDSTKAKTKQNNFATPNSKSTGEQFNYSTPDIPSYVHPWLLIMIIGFLVIYFWKEYLCFWSLLENLTFSLFLFSKYYLYWFLLTLF
jgi:hypothetical protein